MVMTWGKAVQKLPIMTMVIIEAITVIAMVPDTAAKVTRAPMVRGQIAAKPFRMDLLSRLVATTNKLLIYTRLATFHPDS